MPRFIALMIAAVIGATVGTVLRPGIPEIVVVALALTALAGARFFPKKETGRR